MAGGRDDAVVDLKERLLDERGKFCSLRKAAREDELDGGSAALSLRLRALRSKSGAPRSDSSWPMDLATVDGVRQSFLAAGRTPPVDTMARDALI